ncbi:Xaa-Pro dipeptidyl-peptidase [Planotetraspora phitsanulokensis]|uniref:Xaa-Pro dipeptidyl-peptidase n=1 Tax=Planotetraspora phitsanulokensis TaxID=575192 RepID=A0A8J3U9I4_9ACTN|nr:Xaa-Pro dipeptidyl-peptidase [Planotetraspora phitsanulokensis]GII41244.1 Xaa-Pro dipeptidyl-peptidase [Planotetraspora phitsanulokensis]
MAPTVLRSLRSARGAAAALGLAVTATLTGIAANPAPAAANAPVGPVFQNGMAQPVFSSNRNDWIRQEVWVQTPIDSDGDGRNDRVHAEVTRLRETETDGLKSPVVYEVSPYYAGGNPITNHDVDHELYEALRPGKGWQNRGGSVLDPAADERLAAATAEGDGAAASAAATGPQPAISTSHESNWLPRGFAVVHAESLGSGKSDGCPTTGGRNETIGAKSVVDWLNGRAKAYDATGAEVKATWTTGKVGMIGTSYNGTLPNAVASTGVEGLEAIVPISAISSWYDYYRANGAVVAAGGYQGEDTDVLAEYVYTRADKQICRSVIEELAKAQDRVTGDYNAFWDERNYMNDVDKVHAAVLVAHGLNDWNVKTKHAAQWYEALKARGVPHKIYLHQGGHGGSPSVDVLNRWFTRYLWDYKNGVENDPRALIQREDRTLVEYPEWPDPTAKDTELNLAPGTSGAAGVLTDDKTRQGKPVTETIVDDATKTAQTLADAATSPNRLAYKSGTLSGAVRLSGTPLVSLRMSFGQPAANVTALLVDYDQNGKAKIITRGWTDPQNRTSIWKTTPVKPGSKYRLDFDMQPHDYVFPAGHSIGVVLLSSDYEYTIRPTPGATLHLDTTKSTVMLPLVGGAGEFTSANG